MDTLNISIDADLYAARWLLVVHFFSAQIVDVQQKCPG